MNTNDLLVLHRDSWDHHYDYDFTNINDNGKRFVGGDVEYRRTCGWQRFAIKVAGKYEDNVWLGSDNSPGEWPVAYHGTEHDAAKSIAQIGYDLTKHIRFLYDRGIYSTPNINVAKLFAKTFTMQGEE